MNAEFDIVRHPRARRIRLSVDPASGRVRLTVPRRAALRDALAWAEGKREWVAEQRAKLPVALPFAPGAEIPFGDQVLTIDWASDRPRRVTRVDDRLVCGGLADGLNRRVATWLRREALAVLTAETRDYAAQAGVTVTGVAVGDPRARWGSCASGGMIRYSWRLILAPTTVRRATVAHEVAHRVHMNHGPDFHALVAQLFGREPVAENAWLRRHGARLHWFGRASGG